MPHNEKMSTMIYIRLLSRDYLIPCENVYPSNNTLRQQITLAQSLFLLNHFCRPGYSIQAKL
eukprot:c16708_g1_i1 orf=215-400(+)